MVWVLQAVLALAFVTAGFIKINRPKQELRIRMEWVESFSPRSIRLIGAAEILGGLGLILPVLTGVAIALTPLAVVGLAMLMVGAIWLHVTRRDPLASIVPAAVLLGLLVLLLGGLFAVDRV
jgi:uncharacterized membrane protein